MLSWLVDRLIIGSSDQSSDYVVVMVDVLVSPGLLIACPAVPLIGWPGDQLTKWAKCVLRTSECVPVWVTEWVTTVVAPKTTVSLVGLF